MLPLSTAFSISVGVILRKRIFSVLLLLRHIPSARKTALEARLQESEALVDFVRDNHRNYV